MPRLINKDRPSTGTIVGVWEESWQGRALQERQAERYRVWLSSQGRSRDRAAERTVRMLAKERPHEALP
jgi:hypothetical protein